MFRVGLIVAAAAVVIFVGAHFGSRQFEAFALAELRQSSRVAIVSDVSALQSKLQKLRLIPLALSTDPQLLRALEAPEEAARRDLNLRFEEIATASDAAAIYLVDRTGVTFAASNYQSAQSFVGQDYSFREYFQKALQERDAQEFAIGTVSGEPGLYLSRSISGGDGVARGVLVVKVRFKDIEAYWRDQERLVFATDAAGHVVVTPVESLRFRALSRLDDGVHARPLAAAAEAMADGPFLATSQPVAETGWTIVSLEPLRPALAVPQRLGAVSGASLAALMLGALGLLFRRLEHSARKDRETAAKRLQLESIVATRTRDLQLSNAQLSEEISRRETAQASLRVMQEEIAQLNRLAILGQLAAKFAHEINQPLTAMRNYTDSAAKLLASGQNDLVAQNLETLSGLIMRAGRITAELRAFSRKRPSIAAKVEVGRAIDGALLIASPALSSHAIVVDRTTDADNVRVTVDQTRIEQVILNVVQNAIDALRDHPGPRIDIASAFDRSDVKIRIANNGPSVADPGSLFVPFKSDKESGLGLGLSISREILAEYGGRIVYAPGGEGNAAFDILLPRSDA